MTAAKNLFIVSKPLQILVAALIIKQLKIELSSQLIVVDSFHGAQGVYERMKSADWSLRDLDFAFARSKQEAYKLVKSAQPNALFIDADVGLRRFITLLLLKRGRRELSIHVYEEGVGTYNTDLYSGAKKAIFDRLGIGTNFGGSALADSIYVFDDVGYRSRFPESKSTAVKIKRSIADLISQELSSWVFIMNYSNPHPQGSRQCHVYLSSWEIDEAFLRNFSTFNGDKFIKLHPHLADREGFDFARSITSTAPAEIVLMDLASKYDEVHVFHHGTSTHRYVDINTVVFHRC